MATNTDRVIETLRRARDHLDDDELASHAGVHPRQQVNQICRRLEAQGVLQRKPGPSGKIVNRLVGIGR